ncbi:MAG: hypothetical protein OXH40_01100, partial [Chloroflexi bacterium]|nr:hypothetical protein [Chloroflexota bacterium]
MRTGDSAFGLLFGLALAELDDALRAAEDALSGTGFVDVAFVSVGTEAGFELEGAGAGFRLGGGGGEFVFAPPVLLFVDGGQALQQEAQFSGGGDGLAVLVGFGVGGGEDVDLVGEPVGGDGAQDVSSVELEVAEVGVDGGAGAAELGGDCVGGETLAVEVVGFEDASAASGGGWVGVG